MSLHNELLRQARHLATKESRRPLQASLRRAVSAAYYALFHLLVDEAVCRMVSARRYALRDCLRRAFAHSNMRTVAQQFAGTSVAPRLSPGLQGQSLQPDLVKVARAFVDLQEARHEADYNTAWRATRPGALGLIEQTEEAFGCWHTGDLAYLEGRGGGAEIRHLARSGRRRRAREANRIRHRCHDAGRDKSGDGGQVVRARSAVGDGATVYHKHAVCPALAIILSSVGDQSTAATPTPLTVLRT